MNDSNAIVMIARTIAYEKIMRSNPRIAHVKCFFPVSNFSAAPALETRVNAASTIDITAIGAAMYKSVPDMI